MTAGARTAGSAGNRSTGRAAELKRIGSFGTAQVLGRAALLSGVAALALVALQPIDAKAADPETDRKIEKLEQNIEMLKGELDALKKEKAAAEEAPPPKKMITSGKENVKLSISGQVNRMAFYADDGDQGRWFQADNDQSSTRVRFEGEAQIDDMWSAGTNIEVQFESNSSADVTITQNKSVIGSNSFTERKLELWVANKNLGKLTLGQGSTASDSSTEEDLSGTTVAESALLSSLGSSLEFVLSNAASRTESGTTVGDLFDNFDGLSRDDRLRYDSPEFAGFMLSGSWIDGDERDVALRYGREFNGTEVAAAIAYWDAGPTDQKTGFGSSGSVLLPFGTNLTVSYSTTNFDASGRNDANFLYVKLGQQFDAFSVGKTAVSAEYGTTNDQNANDTEGTAWGFAAVQKIDAAAMELYAMVRQYDASIPNTETDKILVGGVGARIKF